MDLGLKGKSAVVTGGSKGIGFAIADLLAKEGAHVSICARNASELEQASATLHTHGGKVLAKVCDVGDADALTAYIHESHGTLGGLDILINNASAFGASEDELGWKSSFDVDLMGSVRGSWAAIPHMEAAGGGAIVHISSISGLQAADRTPPYGAIKAALIQYTKTQALKLAEKNIRVNCVAPGSIYFEGGTWDRARQNNPKVYQSILDSIPSGRFGKPEEVADLTVYLASSAASWVTGETIAVDGGQML